MKTVIFATLLILGGTISTYAQSPVQDSRTFAARLDCGALSSMPAKQGPFTAAMTISFAKGSLTAERPLTSVKGSEKFEGWIDPLGRIEMTGKYEDRLAWVYKLKGQLSDKKPTILVGNLEVVNGSAGHRTCTMTFLERPEEMMAVFSY